MSNMEDNVDSFIDKIDNEDFREVNETEDRLSEYSESKDKYMQKIASKVIKLNQVFSLYYKDLWLKDAEDEGYLENWIDVIGDEEFEPSVIDKAMMEVKDREEYTRYPPNLRDFIELCRELSRSNYNLPTREEAYMIASGNRDIPIKDAHVVVKEAVRRVQEYRVRTDPNIKGEFFKVYKVVCDEYLKADGNVPFNTKVGDLADFKDRDNEEEPPVTTEVAKKHLKEIMDL